MQPRTSRHPDVVIVGAGLIGLGIAWRAAQRGLAVTVLDPSPGTGASHAAAGMLAPITEVHYGEEPLLALDVASAARYPAFVAELEEVSALAVGFRPSGTLAVARDAGDRAELDALAAFQVSLGLEVERLTGREARRLEPLLDPGIRGGLLVTGDHSVDNRRLVLALIAAGKSAGVRLVRQRAVRLMVEHGRAAGVELDDGSLVRAARVVLAAGCWSGALAGVPTADVPPVRPVKGQIVRLRVPSAFRPLLTRTVRGAVRGSGVYLVPREDGELVIGATVEELGFDTTVTAGGVYELLRDARELVPAVGELELVETWAGLRPGSPDNAPLLGEADLPGLVVATGHYRNGVLLTPVTADAIAELLATGTAPALVGPFSPRRFATRRLAGAPA